MVFEGRKEFGRGIGRQCLLGCFGVFGQHFECVDVDFDFKADVHIADGHTVGKSDGSLACRYQFLHGYDLCLQDLYAITD